VNASGSVAFPSKRRPRVRNLHAPPSAADDAEEVGKARDGVDATLGRHPWDGRPPIVLDTSAAVELGYVPVGDYAATVTAELDWLVAAVRGGLALELDDAFFRPFLDYAAEDRYLAARAEPRYTAFQNTVVSHDRPSG